MKRSLTSLALGAAFAATAVALATRAPAQVPAPWPTVFPMATPSPTAALTGTVTASQPFEAQMQTAKGPLTLKLHDRTIIRNPELSGHGRVSFQGIVAGQRVYVLGFPQADGTVRVDEIDIVPPLATP